MSAGIEKQKPSKELLEFAKTLPVQKLVVRDQLKTLRDQLIRMTFSIGIVQTRGNEEPTTMKQRKSTTIK